MNAENSDNSNNKLSLTFQLILLHIFAQKTLIYKENRYII